jgi:serine/threonine protein kinase
MAPEVILGHPYDTKADIWGLGITLYEMATGAPPHADQDHMRALMLIPKLKPPKLPDATDASKEMRDFMALCLRETPGDVSTPNTYGVQSAELYSGISAFICGGAVQK